jgi:hypothetical protein
MKIKIYKLGEKIYHLKFSKQRDLAKTFMRFQEHFESPKFRGKIFTAEEFKKWYRKAKGKFSYLSDYSGFNIPSEILKPFFDGKFDPLSDEEKWMLKKFASIKGKFYIIGSYVEKTKKQSGQTILHELAHALFYFNTRYRKDVLRVLKKTDLSELKKRFKKKSDYHKSVHQDECHAYLLVDLDWMKKTWKINIEPLRQSHEELKKVFKKYHEA